VPNGIENKLVIRFDFDSNIIRNNALLSLNRLADLLIQKKDAQIIIKERGQNNLTF